MPRQVIVAPNVYPSRGYSQAIKIGKAVYVAGVVGLDPKGNLVGKDDAAAQADQTWKNIRSILAAAGAKLEDLVQITTYITRAEDGPKVREVRQKHMPSEPQPTSTLVVCSRLASPDYLIEVNGVAVVD